MNNKQKGELFEKTVASLYESLNFTVETNVNLNGQQVDLIASKLLKGIGETHLVVECKYLSKGSVANQIVYDFSTFINSLQNPNYKGVIVTNLDFSKEAKLAAKKLNLTLLTQHQLESDILDLKEHYQKIRD